MQHKHLQLVHLSECSNSGVCRAESHARGSLPTADDAAASVAAFQSAPLPASPLPAPTSAPAVPAEQLQPTAADTVPQLAPLQLSADAVRQSLVGAQAATPLRSSYSGHSGSTRIPTPTSRGRSFEGSRASGPTSIPSVRKQSADLTTALFSYAAGQATSDADATESEVATAGVAAAGAGQAADVVAAWDLGSESARSEASGGESERGESRGHSSAGAGADPSAPGDYVSSDGGQLGAEVAYTSDEEQEVDDFDIDVPVPESAQLGAEGSVGGQMDSSAEHTEGQLGAEVPYTSEDKELEVFDVEAAAPAQPQSASECDVGSSRGGQLDSSFGQDGRQARAQLPYASDSEDELELFDLDATTYSAAAQRTAQSSSRDLDLEQDPLHVGAVSNSSTERGALPAQADVENVGEPAARMGLAQLFDMTDDESGSEDAEPNAGAAQPYRFDRQAVDATAPSQLGAAPLEVGAQARQGSPDRLELGRLMADSGAGSPAWDMPRQQDATHSELSSMHGVMRDRASQGSEDLSELSGDGMGDGFAPVAQQHTDNNDDENHSAAGRRGVHHDEEFDLSDDGV